MSRVSVNGQKNDTNRNPTMLPSVVPNDGCF